MKKIVPHLWFDHQAKEAAEFYTGIFPDSKIISASILEDTPSGDAQMVIFQLAGQEFQSISGGPLFQFNETMSFMVHLTSVSEIQRIWDALSLGGKVLMPLEEYFFSKKYGWIQDQYGLSWQLLYVEEEPRQVIVPNLLFSGEECGKAEEAMDYYVDIFGGTKEFTSYYQEETHHPKAKVNYGSFRLWDSSFAAMDHGIEQQIGFNESVSFMVACESQEELDYYWERLSAVPEAEACGWLKDAYGLSWQIIPSALGELMEEASELQKEALVQGFLQMKKFDIQRLLDIMKEN